MAEDHDPLAEFRQPYRTLSERAEDRKAAAQARLQAERSRPASEAPGAIEPNYKLWLAYDGQRQAYVKCPSRSGVKIFLCREYGWGDKAISVEGVQFIPSGEVVVTAFFPTVIEANADLGYRSNK